MDWDLNIFHLKKWVKKDRKKQELDAAGPMSYNDLKIIWAKS